jgi:UDP-N-acetylglucosamine/UDP-N-acetylgalactosamine 4-epimerase
VDNVVQANLLAALAPGDALREPVFNVACGARTSLLELFEMIRLLVAEQLPKARDAELRRQQPRAGDIAHSLASIARARDVLGYRPEHDVASGLERTVQWYLAQAGAKRNSATLPLVEATREAS